MGDECAGKSTVLEQLGMMPLFPRHRSFCTRFAIHVRLRRSIRKAGSDGTDISRATVGPADDLFDDAKIIRPPKMIGIEHGCVEVQKLMDELVKESNSTVCVDVQTCLIERAPLARHVCQMPVGPLRPPYGEARENTRVRDRHP
eukprot:3073070-Prymnesium_polylepis.2